jgi:hypothetical protein
VEEFVQLAQGASETKIVASDRSTAEHLVIQEQILLRQEACRQLLDAAKFQALGCFVRGRDPQPLRLPKTPEGPLTDHLWWFYYELAFSEYESNESEAQEI